MVGVLIEMRGAILRRNAAGKRLYGTLALVLVVTLLALSTLWAGLVHYRLPGAGADVLAVLSFGWLLGWVSGPVLTGDDSTLRLDYFKLLPVPARKLAQAMLGAAFANVSLVFSLIAFSGLIAYGAQFGAAPVLVAVAAVLLDLVLAVVASTVAIGVLGPTISSRRGRDFGAMLVALVITLLSLASGLVPLVANRLTSGRSPALSTVVRILPSGWGAVAVDAARRSDWTQVWLCLGGLLVLILALVAVWPAVLRRRLTMSSRGHAKTRHTDPTRAPRRRVLPATPLGAVIGKEARLYSRSTLRSLSLMIAFLVGVLVCVIPALSGVKSMLPFAGPLFTVIAACVFTNLYGDDGSAFWLTMVVPGTERVDVRGRQAAWTLVVAPAGLLLTVVFTAVSGQHWSWPWVLGGEAALLGGSAGLIVLASALSPFPLTADGGPTPQRQLKIHAMLILLPVTTLFPVAGALILGAVVHLTAVTWLAVPVGVAWGSLLCWWFGRITVRRLANSGPELFAKVRSAA